MDAPSGNKDPQDNVTVGAGVTDTTFTVRACVSTYAIMGGFWIVMLVVFLHSAMQGAEGAWSIVGMLGCILVFVLVWVGTFRISISGNAISYRSLLGGARSLHLSEIESAETKIATTEKFGPAYRLILWPEPSTGKKPITINMKVFSKKDIRQVLSFLPSRLQTEPKLSMFSTE